MRNRKKKGFTLVELLVVIAILAILATVSVVGYTAFVDKAEESKAVTELTQVKTLVKAELLLGSVNVTVNTEKITVGMNANGLTFKKGATDVTDVAIKTAALKELVADDIDFEDKLAVNASGDVKYTTNGITAIWDVSEDKVSAQ